VSVLSQHIHFEYDQAQKVLAIRARGDITDDILKACYAMVARLAQGLEVQAAFFDLSDVGRFDVSAATVRHISTLAPALPDPTPRYVIATQAHIFGMARMFQILSPRGRDMLHVVRSARDAYAALGLSAESHFEPLPEPPDTAS
jgi:hypothetical protein